MATATHHKRLFQAPAHRKMEAPAGMREMRFPAMGTTVSILAPERHAQMAEIRTRRLFEEWEQTLSRFRPESELSRLNLRAGESVAVSALLYMTVTTALWAAEETHGLYDPTLRAQIAALGYDRSFEQVSAEQPATRYAGKPGGAWRDIQVDRVRRRVTLPEGAELDFGGVAKGMAVDAALAQLREMGIGSALVNAGGDLAVLGLPLGNVMDSWPIALQGANETAWTIPLRQGAMATSGIGRRHWRQGDTQRHHLIDPRTGLPAQTGLYSVSAVAARCEQAEIAAKVAFLLGVHEGTHFLNRRNIAALFVRTDGSWERVGAWPDEAMRAQLNEVGGGV